MNTEYRIIRIIQIIRIIHNTASPCRIILSLASSSSSSSCIVEVVVCTLQTWDWTKLAASEPKQSVSKMFSLPKVTRCSPLRVPLTRLRTQTPPEPEQTTNTVRAGEDRQARASTHSRLDRGQKRERILLHRLLLLSGQQLAWPPTTGTGCRVFRDPRASDIKLL